MQSVRAKERWTVGVTSIASLMVGLDILVITTALGTIRTELGASVAQLEWMVAAYNLSFAVLLMAAAAVGDRFGRRKMFTVGLVIFTASSAGCAVAPTAASLIIARAAQGVGAALIMPLAFALVSATVAPDRRARALGIAGGVTGLATFCGPLIGGSISELLSWQWIFWVNVPIGAIAAVLALQRLEESRGPDVSFDIRGMSLVSGTMLGLVWSLIRANAVGWSNIEVLVGFSVAASCAAGLVRHERRTAHPVLPVELYRAPGFAWANVATSLHAAVILGSVFWMAQFLQTTMGYSPLEAGVRLLPWTGTLVFVAPLAGYAAHRFGDRAVIITGLSVAAIGYAWLATVVEPGLPYVQVIGPLFVAGVGNSTVFPALQNAVVSSVRRIDIGRATGVNATVREFGGVLGIAALAVMFSAAGGYDTPAEFTDGFAAAMLACAAMSTANALVSSQLPRQHVLEDPPDAHAAEADPAPA